MARHAPSDAPSMAELRATWGRRGCSTNSVSRAAIGLLANGTPVTAAALAEATGVAPAEARAYIEKMSAGGVEIEDGSIVGNALTLRPTAHHFRVRGHDLFTWCGFDALFLPILIGEPAEVRSTCPVTGTEIRLAIQPDGEVIDPSPATMVVGIVGKQVTSCCSAGPTSPICTQMPFFASREAGERWLVDHPGVAIADLDDAGEIARIYVQGS